MTADCQSSRGAVVPAAGRGPGFVTRTWRSVCTRVPWASYVENVTKLKGAGAVTLVSWFCALYSTVVCLRLASVTEVTLPTASYVMAVVAASADPKPRVTWMG